MDPLVSVIIPVCKGEKYLDQCLQSVINQTLRGIEIIIINNGSVDGCEAIVARHAAIDKRIKHITLKKKCRLCRCGK